MSFQAVSERLSTLQESNEQLKILIDRLATIKFQPGSVPLGDEEDNVMGELTAEIQQTIKDQDEDFELLQEEVLDLDTGRRGSELEHQRDSLAQSVKRAVKELKTCEISFRKAQIAARSSLRDARRSEKQLLLQSYSNPPSTTASPAPSTTGLPLPQRKPKGELSKDEREVNASSDVTAALRRTHDMMASELQRSQFAHDTLKESTEALTKLTETYSTLDTLLSTSKNLLGTLLRSQKSDTWYLLTSFYILSFLCAWLVFRRILWWPIYYPTYWLLWFLSYPLTMFFRGWMGVFAALGLSGVSSSVSLSPTSISSGGNSATVTHRTAGSRTRSFARPPPSVNVGGAYKREPTPSQRPAAEKESVSEQVGKIIDESKEEEIEQRQEEDASAEEDAELERNPKKRMWEEPIEAAKEQQRVKDEL